MSGEEMKDPSAVDVALERRAMNLTRWANLGMGLAGALAAWASNSQAMLIDGLFSLVGYISAVYAMKVSQTVHLGPDRLRPFGHAADEALYATFRSLALIGLVVYGIAQAVLGITDYLLGGDVETVRLAPVAVYTVLVAGACFWLAWVHRRAWKKTGRKSEMLRLETMASIYDGIITLCAGIGLLSTPYMAGTLLEPLAPVMDSIVVLVLCSLAVLSYFGAFRKGVAQLAGIPASVKDQIAVRHALKRAIGAGEGRIVDVALVRVGRLLDAVVYFEPNRPVTAEQVDEMTARMVRQVNREVGLAAVLVVVSRFGRTLSSGQQSG